MFYLKYIFSFFLFYQAQNAITQSFDFYEFQCGFDAGSNDFDQANISCSKAYEAGKHDDQVNPVKLWQVMQNKAYALFMTGKADSAEIFYEEIVRDADRRNLNKDAIYLYSLSNLIAIKSALYKYDDVIKLCDQGILAAKNYVSDTTKYIFQFYETAAKTTWFTNNFSQADAYYQQKGDAYRKKAGYADTNYAYNLLDRANVQLSLGRDDKAIDYTKEAIAIFDKYPMSANVQAGCYKTVSTIYFIQNDADKALENILPALEIYRRINRPDYASQLAYYTNLILYKYEKDMPPEILQDCENNALEWQHIFDSLHYARIEYPYNIQTEADIYNVKGDKEKAIEITKELCNIYSIKYGSISDEYNRSLKKLFYLYTSVNEPDSALKYIRLSITSMDDRVKQSFDIMSEKDKELVLQDLYLSNELLQSFYHNHSKTYPNLSAEIYNNILFSKGILLRNISLMRENILQANDKKLLSVYDTWLDEKKQLAVNYTAGNKSDRALSDSMEMHEKLLMQQAPQGNQFFTNTTWRMIQDKLAADACAIEFTAFRTYSGNWDDSIFYYAYIILPNSKQPVAIKLFEEKTLESTIIKRNSETDASYVRRLYTFPDPEFADDTSLYAGNELYNEIWQPLEKYLSGIKTIYISPTDYLNSISFDAITVNQKQHLIDLYTIKQLNNTADILHVNNKIHITDATLIGGIDYNNTADMPADNSALQTNTEDSTRGGSFNYLPGTLKEINAINALLQQSNIRVSTVQGKAASEKYFKNLSRQAPSVIHLSTHGFFYGADSHVEYADENKAAYSNLFIEASNPLLRSGLIMAGGNDSWQHGIHTIGDEDGILTAYEISNLDLQHTSLVVLSACETGLGENKGTEGSYGLQRAFKLAGADKLIISLWQVPDAYTSQLMKLFYEELLADNDCSKALRNAKLRMAKITGVYNWAAFILVE